MGLEVVVRPVILPNIRPSAPRQLAQPDNPDQGIVVLGGGSPTFVATSYSMSMSYSSSHPQIEVKRQVDVERIYQMDDQGNVNKDNFVDVERMKKIKLTDDGTDAGGKDDKNKPTSLVYAEPEDKTNRTNIAILEADKTILNTADK